MLTPGSWFEIRSSFGDESDPKNRDGLRTVTMSSVSPLKTADLRWLFVRRMENEEASSDEQELTVTGSLEKNNLLSSHRLFVPAYWPTGDRVSSNTSGIWLSNDAYLEFLRTRVSTVYWGVFDTDLQGALPQSSLFQQAISALKLDAQQISNRVDVDLMEVDPEAMEWETEINGSKVTVLVRRARNWFGEIYVLDNPNNPLLVKMVFDPKETPESDSSGTMDFLRSLFSYEITRFDNI